MSAYPGPGGFSTLVVESKSSEENDPVLNEVGKNSSSRASEDELLRITRDAQKQCSTYLHSREEVYQSVFDSGEDEQQEYDIRAFTEPDLINSNNEYTIQNPIQRSGRTHLNQESQGSKPSAVISTKETSSERNQGEILQHMDRLERLNKIRSYIRDLRLNDTSEGCSIQDTPSKTSPTCKPLKDKPSTPQNMKKKKSSSQSAYGSTRKVSPNKQLITHSGLHFNNFDGSSSHASVMKNRNKMVINQFLYEEALARQQRKQNRESEELKKIQTDAVSSKMSLNSFKMAYSKMEQTIQNLVERCREDDYTLTYQGFLQVLFSLGIIRRQERQRDLPSFLSPRTSSAFIFDEMREQEFPIQLWKILNYQNSEAIESDLLRDALVILHDSELGKTAKVTKLSLLINLSRTLRGSRLGSSGDEKESDEDTIWDYKKLVSQYDILRKKSVANCGIKNVHEGVIQELKEKEKHNTYRPKVNPRSEELDQEIIAKKFQETNQYKLKHRPTQSFNGEKRYQLLYHKEQQLQARLSNQRKENEAKQLAQCTFKPTLQTAGSKEHPVKSVKSRLMNPTSASLNRDVNRDCNLSSDGVAIKTSEQIAAEQCTFHPKIHASEDTFRNPHNRKSHSEALIKGIKGFDKSVSRLQRGFKELKEKKHRMAYVPRGENYERNKNMPHRPFSFYGRERPFKRPEALVYIDVNVAPGKTGRIAVHPGDSPRELARNFSKAYQLNKIMQESLEVLLREQIDRDPKIASALMGNKTDDEGEEREEDEYSTRQIEENGEYILGGFGRDPRIINRNSNGHQFYPQEHEDLMHDFTEDGGGVRENLTGPIDTGELELSPEERVHTYNSEEGR